MRVAASVAVMVTTTATAIRAEIFETARAASRVVMRAALLGVLKEAPSA